MKALSFLVLIFSFFIFPAQGLAHPGGTNAYGCHTCRTNCPSWGLSYDEYHCHNAKALPQPEEPIKSTHGEGGTGYTQPAPEYKAPTPTIPAKTVDTQIQETVSAERTAYYRNPHWFRERLIQ